MKLRRVEYSDGPIKDAQPHEIRSGWFHRWFQYVDRDEAGVLAVIEHEDGTLGEYSPVCVRFTDKPNNKERLTNDDTC